jgi:HAD superfamily hydrolase (TIGR01509 family)
VGLSTPEHVVFEPALPVDEDARMIMEWRNDPQTLAMSFHRAPKAWNQFRREFLAEYFDDPELPPQFARCDGERVAFLRFNRIPHRWDSARRCCDIGINVEPSRRGRGIGSAVLRALRPLLNAFEIDDVIAEIRVENRASQRVFEKAGFFLFERTHKLVEDTREKAVIMRYWKRIGGSGEAAKLRALFLDLDGTLADSLPILRRVYDEFLAEHELVGSGPEFDRLNGASIPEIIGYLVGAHSLPDPPARLAARYLELVRANHAESPMRPGTQPLLQHARRFGLRIALVTSAVRELAGEWLDRHGISDYFDIIISGDDVGVAKPDPAIYRRALAALWLLPGEARAVEDSWNGIRSATRAGIYTFAIHTNPPEEVLPAGAGEPVNSLVEVMPRLARACRGEV